MIDTNVLAKRLGRELHVLEPDRRLIHEWEGIFCKTKTSKKKKVRYMVLFTDLLLVCKKVKGYQARVWVPLIDLQIEDITQNSEIETVKKSLFASAKSFNNVGNSPAGDSNSGDIDLYPLRLVVGNSSEMTPTKGSFSSSSLTKMKGNFRRSARLSVKKFSTDSYALYFPDITKRKEVWSMLRSAIDGLHAIQRNRELSPSSSSSSKTQSFSSNSNSNSPPSVSKLRSRASGCAPSSAASMETTLGRQRSASHSTTASAAMVESKVRWSMDGLPKRPSSSTRSRDSELIQNNTVSGKRIRQKRPAAPPPPLSNMGGKTPPPPPPRTGNSDKFATRNGVKAPPPPVPEHPRQKPPIPIRPGENTETGNNGNEIENLVNKWFGN
uniref:PH domain-containing protein n=1 Tax=Aplanochytrium stocchinoi TaxID=215587 RepID=A0A7S3PE60_9STRA